MRRAKWRLFCLGAAGKAANLGGCKSLYRQLLDADGEHIHCSGREQTEICVDVQAMAAWGRKKLSHGRNDLGGEQTRRPEHHELPAAPKTNACMKSFCGNIMRRPTHLGFGEGRCLMGRNEHVHHEDSRGKGPGIRGKICGDNAGKGLVPVGAHSNRRRLGIRAKAKRHRGSRSDA